MGFESFNNVCTENHAELQPGDKCPKCGYTVEEIKMPHDPKKSTLISYGENGKVTKKMIGGKEVPLDTPKQGTE